MMCDINVNTTCAIKIGAKFSGIKITGDVVTGAKTNSAKTAGPK